MLVLYFIIFGRTETCADSSSLRDISTEFCYATGWFAVGIFSTIGILSDHNKIAFCHLMRPINVDNIMVCFGFQLKLEILLCLRLIVVHSKEKIIYLNSFVCNDVAVYHVSWDKSQNKWIYFYGESLCLNAFEALIVLQKFCVCNLSHCANIWRLVVLWAW